MTVDEDTTRMELVKNCSWKKSPSTDSAGCINRVAGKYRALTRGYCNSVRRSRCATETFGALAYHTERRLVFLKSRASSGVSANSRAPRRRSAPSLRPNNVIGAWQRSVRCSVRDCSMGADTSLRQRFERGLAAPICLTWELTYACNLACTHCPIVVGAP